MKAREGKIPAKAKPRLAEAGERVAQLYVALGKTEKGLEWRKKLGLKAPEIPRKSSLGDLLRMLRWLRPGTSCCRLSSSTVGN